MFKQLLILISQGNPKLKVVLKLGKKSNSSPNAVSQPIVFNEPRKSETGSFEFSEKSQVPSKPIVVRVTIQLACHVVKISLIS